MSEVSDEPPVALLDEEDKDPEKEERKEDNAGTVVSATFHYGVHFSLSLVLSQEFSLLTL